MNNFSEKGITQTATFLSLILLSVSAVVAHADEEFSSSVVRDVDINTLAPLDNVVPVSVSQRGGLQVTFTQSSLGGNVLEATSTDTIDAGVDYLIQNQNADGSWETQLGTATIDTLAVAEVFEATGSTTDPVYSLAVEWIDSSVFSNTAHLAERVRIVSAGDTDVGLNDDFLVAQISQSDGGFGFEAGYVSDAVTTSKVLRAITASGYEDSGEDNDFTLTSILVYFIEHQNADGGWSEAPGAPSSVFATAHVLEALEAYQDVIVVGLPGGDVRIDAISADALGYLSNIQQSDGTWNGRVLDTALAYRQLFRYAAEIVYQDEALNFILNAQGVDGSWENGNFYITAKALQALIDADLGRPDLTILDVVPTTPLENGEPSEFRVTTQNEGGQAVTDGVLHLFVDDYLFFTYDLADLGFGILPGQSIDILVSFADSVQFVADTEFRWYIETSNEFDYTDNWHSSVFTFAEDGTGTPSLPVYQVEYGVLGGSGPGAQYVWSTKPDSNREDYVLGYRPQGNPNWVWIAIGNPDASSVVLSGFPEGSVYEFTLGVLYGNGTLVRFMPNVFATIQLSVDPDIYAGTVSGTATINNKGADGVNLDGFSQTDVLSNPDGTFTFTNVNNGTNVFWVDDPVLYEQNLTKVTIPANGTATGTRLYTRLKSDTEAPVVSNFEVVGESDMVFENNQTVTLSVEASDNEALKEADFRLIDPDTGNKSYLGTSFFAPVGTTTTSFDWFVPIEEVGAGYELEVIVQDYQNNGSVPSLFGPFEITAGAIAPTITILEPGGATTTADEFVTIVWKDDDEDDDASVALYYDTDASGEDGTLIVEGLSEDSPLDQYAWDALPVPDGDYYVYGVIGDGTATSTDYSDGFVTLAHVNDPPVATDDTYTTDEDVALVVATSTGVLANDTDIDSAVLTASVVASTTRGTLDLQSDGSFTYTPDQDFNGTDSFVYEVSDGELTDQATVTIDVLPLNDVPIALNDSYTTSEDTVLSVDASSGVLANDTDDDGDVLSAVLIADVPLGALTFNSDGSFDYTPPQDFFGTTTFSYAATDEQATSSEALVTLSVSAVNDPPVAVDDAFTTDEDTPLSGDVLVNDSDPENDSLSALLIADVSSGALVFNSDGLFTYTPNTDFFGVDSFVYELSDGALTDIATVTIDVMPQNDLPVALDEAYSGTEDTQLLVTAPGVLANDTDADGDTLTPILVSDVATGTLVLNTDGSFTYDPPLDFNGTTTFTYATSDGVATSSEATVTLSVAPVNDLPTIAIVEPDGLDDNATSTYTIVWTDADPDSNASIDLFFDTDGAGQDGMLIASGIFEDDALDAYVWDTSALPNGSYFVYATIDDGEFSTTTYSAGVVTITNRTETVYEDAEDGDTLGWTVRDNNPPGATITNVFDGLLGSSVIMLSGDGQNNAYMLSKENGDPFENTTEFVAEWSVKATSTTDMAWRVQTDLVSGFVIYTRLSTPGCSARGMNIWCDIDEPIYNGQWHTITRDVAADVRSAAPNATLVQIDNFVVRGSARVDDIKLMSTLP